MCLAAAGGSDNISSIFRQTILQTAVPDHLRGRTQGVFTVVVTGGPRLGQMFAGTPRDAHGDVGALARRRRPRRRAGLAGGRPVPSFRDYDALDPRP